MFDRVLGAVRRHKTISQTRRELERLSDRELRDIGVSRAEIMAIARRAA